jgi:3-oxoacyl-[acyl-carrier-protein] synthase-3
VVTNDDLAKIVDTSDEWIRTRTGIRQRRFAAEGETTSDMAAAAAKNALEAAGIGARDLDLILVATVTPDTPLPSTAMFVQQKIGARSDCPGFDLAAACAGFIYGLSVADAYVRAGLARHVLVIGVELLSRVLDFRDRTTCVLFGDGAGAVVVSGASPGSESRILSTHIFGDGQHAESLTIPAGGAREPTTHATVEMRRHFVHMIGKDIFKIAVKNMSAASVAALDYNRVTFADVDWCVPHQANIRILEGVAQRCDIPMEKFFLNIDRVGNTSSASVPIALDEGIRSGAIRPGHLVVMGALGGGIAWGSALVRL